MPSPPEPKDATRFFTLTPQRVLEAVEQSGHGTTGYVYALNSLENRVYEVGLASDEDSEQEDGRRVVGKFYRPGRWSRETILAEHRLVTAIAEAEIPVAAPLPFPDGDTLHETPEGIMFALFDRAVGRSPEEIGPGELEQLGRLIARIHNVAASLELSARPELSPQTYGRECLDAILARAAMPDGLRMRYRDLVERLIELAGPRFDGLERFVAHADCHRGNLLRGPAGWLFLDFDDSARAPPVQDIWLLLPGRVATSESELEALLGGYEQFRPFDRTTLGLIEILRALRYVRYAAWVAVRWEDPAFPRAFPAWGTDQYWSGQVADLHEQLRIIETGVVEQNAWY